MFLPASTAAVLNRVVGADPSVIAGQLQSNGRVFLVNPNGVLVGPGVQVLTNGFTASTRDLDNATFLRGEALRLTGDSSAAVINQGSIVAREGDVVLRPGGLRTTASSRPCRHRGPGAAAARAARCCPATGRDRLLVSIRVALTSPLTPPPAPGATNPQVQHTGHIEAAAADLRAGKPTCAGRAGQRRHIRASRSAARAANPHLSGQRAHRGAGHAGREQHHRLGRRSSWKAGTWRWRPCADRRQRRHRRRSAARGGGFQGGEADVANAASTTVRPALDSRRMPPATARAATSSSGRWRHPPRRLHQRRGAGAAFTAAPRCQASALQFNGSADLRATDGSAGTLLLDPTDVTISTAPSTITADKAQSNISVNDIQAAL